MSSRRRVRLPYLGPMGRDPTLLVEVITTVVAAAAAVMAEAGTAGVVVVEVAVAAEGVGR